MTENELRDELAKDIGVLEHGLTLLAKEKYLPNSLGTRGFVDLYARDPAGHHVLIELKRSDAAAREAIHEIHKYVEGVKAHLGARDDEIRIIVASTEWKELLVPFSRLLNETHMTLVGIELTVDSVSGEISANPVIPLETTKGRFIAQWHELNLYENLDSLKCGIASYESSCSAKGIEDYILIVLEAHEDFNEHAKEQLRASLDNISRQFGDGTSDPQRDERVSSLPSYQYILYFAPQTLSKETCLAAIASDQERLDEVSACLNDMGEEEGLCFLHENVYEMQPDIHRDYYEIGYPAKFGTKILDQEQWRISEIKRYGAFSRNSLLQDESIIEEIRGNTGITGQRFKRRVSAANRAHMSVAKDDLRDCLEDNPVWQAHILRHLAEIESTFPMSDIEISVFNPCAGIMTIYFAVTRDDGALYVPSYSIIVYEEEERRIYYGCLVPEGKSIQLIDVLNKYYEGDLSRLLLTLSWGGYESRDTEILEDIGLVYRSFYIDINGDDRDCFNLREERWRSSQCINPHEYFNKYIEENHKVIRQIICRIQPSLQAVGGLVQTFNIHHHLHELADLPKGRSIGKYWHSSVTDCDICSGPLNKEKYIIDGALKDGSGWALMCPDCFSNFGEEISYGSGQLYFCEDGQWLMVGGFE